MAKRASRTEQHAIPGLQPERRARGARAAEREEMERLRVAAGLDSELEARFLASVRAAGVPDPQAQVWFHPRGLWRFDFAWPERMLAVEVQGGVWTQGRHTRGAGFAAECVKRRAAVLGGWRVLEYTGEEVRSGFAAQEIARIWPFVAEVRRVLA